ncbi:hydrogenase maturation protease [Thermanaeromonas toyohensis ToBE]|uniref:Hydrogenase maturation protease n=1 Tax=Thermanaeromonas toyohensis ToBE TaxID=698762 RepID=A0A1W1VZY2_9FIRM|nr:hydrogenase maturation protease [Thermanaeromonas toyohensis]SMB98886.1 hydrogenase maturation protease [Thermanaeromonas toyohensis ToBE]
MALVKIIGCGNPLAGDDGVGLKVIEELKRWGLPPGVRLISAGLPGLTILDLMRGADQVIIVDAVEAGQKPGTVIHCKETDLARVTFRSLSLHNIGIAEALSLGRLVEPEAFPRRLDIVGVQIAEITWGKADLSPLVAAALPLAVHTVYNILKGGGPYA